MTTYFPLGVSDLEESAYTKPYGPSEKPRDYCCYDEFGPETLTFIRNIKELHKEHTTTLQKKVNVIHSLRI